MTTLDEIMEIKSLKTRMEATVLKMKRGGYDNRKLGDEYFEMRRRREDLIERLDSDGIEWED